MQRLVFAPNNEALRSSTQFLVTANLRRWLGDAIDVDAVTVSSVPGAEETGHHRDRLHREADAPAAAPGGAGLGHGRSAVAAPRLLRAGAACRAQGILRVAVPDGPPRLLITLAKEITDGAGATLPGAEYALDRWQLQPHRRPAPLSAHRGGGLPARTCPTRAKCAATLDVLGDFSIYTLSLSGPDVRSLLRRTEAALPSRL